MDQRHESAAIRISPRSAAAATIAMWQHRLEYFLGRQRKEEGTVNPTPDVGGARASPVDGKTREVDLVRGSRSQLRKAANISAIVRSVTCGAGRKTRAVAREIAT